MYTESHELTESQTLITSILQNKCTYQHALTNRMRLN